LCLSGSDRTCAQVLSVQIAAPHLGALYVRRELLARLPFPRLHFMDPTGVGQLEHGTAQFEALAGWVAALAYFAEELGGAPAGAPLTRAALEAAWARVAELEAPVKSRLWDGLSELIGQGVEVFGRAEERVGTVAFRVGTLAPAEVARALGDVDGVCVSAGHFYATMPCEKLGLTAGGGVVRASIAHYTSLADVDRLLAGVLRLCRKATQ
jgi:selenocysteine lyase/cysteine desulfurase